MDYQKSIKKLREKMILSQTEFAKELGVSFTSVNRWENGQFKPTIKAKRKIKKMCIKNHIDMKKYERERVINYDTF